MLRGVGDADNWKLIPAAWRPEKKNLLKPLIHEVKKLKDQNSPQKDWESNEFGVEALHWINAECEAICQFSKLAIELGNCIPEENRSPLKSKYLYRDEMFRLPNTQIAKHAQHHGIPPRLLDWTKCHSSQRFSQLTHVLEKMPNLILLFVYGHVILNY
ncbi:MAG: FRG domain-containing protein [Candidatus Thiodiazotropha sp.]